MRMFLLFVFSIALLCTAGLADDKPAEKARFNEIWAYLMPGEEPELKGSEPITDLCYFTGEISYRGELRVGASFPSSAKLPPDARVHLVIADIRNQDLIHFLVNPDLPYRNRFLKSLKKASASYSGVQIDFESVNLDDRKNFYSFLRDIKKQLGAKILSIALPARVEEKKTDVFCYKTISKIVDRIFIMAYDQHWSGSKPGPVASAEWCERVARYAASSVPADRLIMGIPFYGRSWQSKKNDRALRFLMTQNLIKETGNSAITHFDGPNPGFEYEESVKVTVYYENRDSILNKAGIYRSEGIQGIGFWRIGQGPAEIWDLLERKADPLR